MWASAPRRISRRPSTESCRRLACRTVAVWPALREPLSEERRSWPGSMRELWRPAAGRFPSSNQKGMRSIPPSFWCTVRAAARRVGSLFSGNFWLTRSAGSPSTFPVTASLPALACRIFFSYSRVIEGFIQALGLRGPVLGGHSMGGGIALACALAFPEKLGGIALIGSGARLRVLSSILEGVRTRFLSGVDEIIEYSFSSRAPSDLVAEGRKKLLACPPEVVHGDFSACNAFDQMDKVDTVRLPALIVCGEEDKLTPPKYSVYLAERIPGASLCLVPEAGHMVMVEKPREVGEAVLNFLRRL